MDLEFEAEDGWDVTISPSQVDLLKPQQSYTFDVVMETPTDTVSGDYLVTLTGISDQTESNPMANPSNREHFNFVGDLRFWNCHCGSSSTHT